MAYGNPMGNPLGNPLGLARSAITSLSSIGAILSHTGAAGTNELPADGRALSKASYSALYNAIGEAYTVADVSSGFTQPALPASTTWANVAYGAGLFVAISTGGLSAISADKGLTWQSGGALPAGTWNCIIYGAGLFVAVSTGSVSYCATSPDGSTWTQRAMPVQSNWSAVAYGAGRFIAVGSSAASAYSFDGVIWVQGGTTALTVNSFRLAFGGGRFVGVANATSISTAIATTDGVTWSAVTLPSSAVWSSIAYGNGFFVAVSSASGGVPFAASWDGINWLSGGAAGSSQSSLITFAAGKFFFSPSSGTTMGSMDYPLRFFAGLTCPAGYTAASAFGGGAMVLIYNSSIASSTVARINLWGGPNFNLPNLTSLDPDKTTFVRAS